MANAPAQLLLSSLPAAHGYLPCRRHAAIAAHLHHLLSRPRPMQQHPSVEIKAAERGPAAGTLPYHLPYGNRALPGQAVQRLQHQQQAEEDGSGDANRVQIKLSDVQVGSVWVWWP